MTDPEMIYEAVATDSALGLLISGRLYPVVLPPDPALPAVTYQLASQATDFTQDDAQYRTPRWRFTVYSLLYSDLVPIAVALAALFGDQARTPFTRSWIEYPTGSLAEGHEKDTHRYWRILDVVAGWQVAGAVAQ